MHTWTEDNGVLTIDYRPGSGCRIYVILGIFGAMFVLFAGFISLIVLSSGFPRILQAVFMLVLCFFGLLTGIAIFRNLRQDFTLQATVTIDPKTETVGLHNTDTKSEFQIGLGELDHIRLQKVKAINSARDTNISRYDYQIFLVKKDGSAYWLDTQYEAQKESFANHIDQLTQYIGIEVRDFTEFNLDQSATQAYSNVVDGQYKPSNWVVELKDDQGTIFTLKPKRSILNTLVNILIYSIFCIIPATMVMMISDMASPFLFDLLFFLILAVYLAGILLLLLAQLKRYILRLEQDTLAIRLAFVFPLFDRILGRLLAIPKDMIQYACVHRIANGHFWLALSVEPSSLPVADKVLFGVGVFQKQGLENFKEDDTLIGLWEISGWRHNKSTTPQDLSYIAKIIQNHYQLTP